MSHETLPALLMDQLETILQRRLIGGVRDLRVELEGEGLVLRGCAQLPGAPAGSPPRLPALPSSPWLMR